jgi:hypothetical protein
MLDDAATAVATGAAGNIVAYMLSGQVESLRDQVARLFRHGTEEERSAALRTLEDDAVAVSQQKASETELTEQWTNLLLSYLAARPEARRDIEAFTSSPIINGATNVGSQHNHGSGTFIGGNNYGGIIFGGHE